MLKSIEKQCEVSYDTIVLRLYDTRDNYIISDAMGKIGEIYLSKDGVFIYPDYANDDKIRPEKEKILIEAFKEIFGTTEFDPLSSVSYNAIKSMIENRTLENLGYTIVEDKDYDYPEFDDFITKKVGR